MSKKILIINGSPRAHGNTATLIDHFVQGAKEAGHTIKRFDLRKMNIHPCLGCMKGGKNPASPCAQKDDMEQIYPVIERADVIVLASPLYCWHFSAQLKCVIDRMFALMETGPDQQAEEDSDQQTETTPDHQIPQKEAVLLMAAGGNGFESADHYYQTLLRGCGWRDLGHIYAGDVYAKGDIAGHPALEKARQLGASIE